MKEKILKLREEGKSYNEIKKILGCSKGTISYHCAKIDNDKITKSINLDIKNKRQTKDDSFLLPSEDIITKVVELRKMLKTYKEISDELKLSKDSISKICRILNLDIKRKYGKKITNEEIEEIKKLYEDLKNIRKVAEISGISRDSIRKYVKINTNEKLSECELKKNKVKSVVNWRIRTKQKLVEYKGGECVKCGYNKCITALQFHHEDPNEKDFSISGKSWSFERLKKEVDKCILLCSNCHTELHEEINKMHL